MTLKKEGKQEAMTETLSERLNGVLDSSTLSLI